MSCLCFIRYFYIWFRFLRYKFYPWTTLATTPLNLLMVSGIQRTHTKIRYLSAMSKIDFASVYGLLNDLIW
ncbi:hypothetical protein WA1_13555 [Scytonema hofmannii PCC 7110]|uniref:Uncharacterized protein n=1 Tax=Scytonema hofmannii PCC 7110 TaxID=128403 RepID=A0A139XEJ3_9CYAN|nr:hypothetical protein WA1_13555 [Scytonema hofmannii PCC 7110]